MSEDPAPFAKVASEHMLRNHRVLSSDRAAASAVSAAVKGFMRREIEHHGLRYVRFTPGMDVASISALDEGHHLVVTDEELVAEADPRAIVLHCLPAYRGLEISAGAMESSSSRIFDQAENRLHAQQALLTALLGES